MRGFIRIVAFGVLVVTACLIAVPVSADPGSDGSAETDGKLVMVLDSSGSMKEKDASGQTKIAAAKQALNTVVDKLPEQAQVGLRVYGAKVFSRKDAGACQDSQLVVPVGRADKSALKSAIGAYKPYGETPIGYALQEAAKDLGNQGQRSIVLVSDGEPTCQPDPCKVAAQLAKQGIDLKIDVVGLNVSGKARSALQCIAAAGNGTYYDAGNASELASGLTRMSTRAFRPFSVAGTPIKGTLAKESAPDAEPGQYTDTLGGTGTTDGKKYYKLKHTKGSTIHANVTARPKAQSSKDITTDGVQLRLSTPTGEECGFTTGSRVDTGGSAGLVIATMVETPGAESDEECGAATSLILEVLRKADSVVNTGDSGPADIELVYYDEPAVKNTSSLPAAVNSEAHKAKVVPEASTVGDVVGGASFNDAAELVDGTVKDTLRPGEILFYKVKADWGQTPAVTMRAKADPRVDALISANHIQVQAYAPDRSDISVLLNKGQDDTIYTGTEDVTLDYALTEVRYNNREDFNADAVSLGGYYYFAISLGADPDGDNWQVPLTISTDVAGSVKGAPEYVKPAVKPTPTPKSTPKSTPTKDAAAPADSDSDDNGGGFPLLLVVGIAVGVIVLAGLAFWLGRRGKGSGPSGPSGPSAPNGPQGNWPPRNSTPQNPAPQGYGPQGPPPQRPSQGSPQQGSPQQGPPPQGYRPSQPPRPYGQNPGQTGPPPGQDR